MAVTRLGGIGIGVTALRAFEPKTVIAAPKRKSAKPPRLGSSQIRSNVNDGSRVAASGERRSNVTHARRSRQANTARR